MISVILATARVLARGIPGSELVVGAWRLLAAPIGRIALVAAVAFSGGWHIKARLDRSATQQAVVAKQRIDLRAAQDAVDGANAVLDDLSRRDAANQEVIRDLERKLGQMAGATCSLDDAAARELLRIQ
jgi:vacuolar-type H+-ATPase subunit I/STV1